MNIKEQRESLKVSLRDPNWVCNCSASRAAYLPPCSHQASASEYALRDADLYALAVLDAAMESVNRVLVEVVGEDPIFGGHTLRRRIEELGKTEDKS